MLFLTDVGHGCYEKRQTQTRRHPPMCRRGFTRCQVVVGLGQTKRNGGSDFLKTAVSVDDTEKRTKSSARQRFFSFPRCGGRCLNMQVCFMPQRPKHTVLVSQFELEFNSCFRWLIFTIGNFNRCSLVRDFVSCANPFSADVIFSVYRIFDLDSMRKGCAIHSMSADRFTIHF